MSAVVVSASTMAPPDVNRTASHRRDADQRSMAACIAGDVVSSELGREDRIGGGGCVPSVASTRRRLNALLAREVMVRCHDASIE
jgi:hypothetical protein